MAIKKTQFSTARKRAVFKRRLSNEVVRYVDGAKPLGKPVKSKATEALKTRTDASLGLRQPARFRSAVR